MLDISLKVRREDDHILFPVISESAASLGYNLEEEDFEQRELADTDYKDMVEVPEDLRYLLPTSFDVVGEVAIIRIPDELLPYKERIGLSLRKASPRLTAVALDKGVKGELRVRDLEVIAGGPGTETIHTEYGIKLLVDPSKTYFNPRLSNERFRVAKLVREGEVVIDMFAGVGPFSIMIARHASPKAVYAIDLNRDAVEYLRRNIELNRALSVKPIQGDARDEMRKLPQADRIIMNLPHSAREFLRDALTHLRPNGTIHLYQICDRGEIEDLAKSVLGEADGMGFNISLARLEELKTYSPSMSVYALDLLLLERS